MRVVSKCLDVNARPWEFAVGSSGGVELAVNQTTWLDGSASLNGGDSSCRIILRPICRPKASLIPDGLSSC